MWDKGCWGWDSSKPGQEQGEGNESGHGLIIKPDGEKKKRGVRKKRYAETRLLVQHTHPGAVHITSARQAWGWDVQPAAGRPARKR